MWNIPNQDKLIYLHFFVGGSNWYIAELDGDDTFGGLGDLKGDIECTEWGYFSFADLLGIPVVGGCEIDWELESHCEMKVFCEIGNLSA